LEIFAVYADLIYQRKLLDKKMRNKKYRLVTKHDNYINYNENN